MTKRYTDSDIWKEQRWFRMLPPMHKIAYFYVKDNCDYAGIWKIDCATLIDETGLKNFDLLSFIDECNTETDGFTGAKLSRERLKVVDGRYLWVTGFIQFQNGAKDGFVSLKKPTVPESIQILKKHNLYDIAIDSGFLSIRDNDSLLEPKQEPSSSLLGPQDIVPVTVPVEVAVTVGDKGVQGEKGKTPVLELRDAICEYFSIKQMSKSKIYNSVCDFLMVIKHRNEIQMASMALQKYMAYKARSQEQAHNLKNWIGTRDNDYRDGQWIMIDWDLKNKNYTPQPKKDFSKKEFKAVSLEKVKGA